jgi:hypothetical protein
VSLPVPPQTTAKGFDVVARFTLLRRPLRIRNCALVRAPDGKFLVWTPHEDVKIGRTGQPALVEAILCEVEAAKECLVG